MTEDGADDPEFKIEAGERGLWASISLPPVYVTPLATIYHQRADCPFLGEPKWAVSEQAAVERGLSACPECEP